MRCASNIADELEEVVIKLLLMVLVITAVELETTNKFLLILLVSTAVERETTTKFLRMLLVSAAMKLETAVKRLLMMFFPITISSNNGDPDVKILVKPKKSLIFNSASLEDHRCLFTNVRAHQRANMSRTRVREIRLFDLFV